MVDFMCHIFQTTIMDFMCKCVKLFLLLSEWKNDVATKIVGRNMNFSIISQTLLAVMIFNCIHKLMSFTKKQNALNDFTTFIIHTLIMLYLFRYLDNLQPLMPIFGLMDSKNSRSQQYESSATSFNIFGGVLEV